MMEMQLIVSLVIRNYDLELLHGVPDPVSKAPVYNMQMWKCSVQV